MTTADEKMREDYHTQHIMMMRSPEQQDESIIRHYAATAALARNGVTMVDAKRAGQRGDALDAGIAHIADLLKKAHRNDFGVSLPCIDSASAAQYTERIKELEQQNEQLKAELCVAKSWIENAVGIPISTWSETVKHNDQLQAQASSACEFYQSIIDANYRTWDCGLDNAEEFVRWIKSRAVHALSMSDTKTAEAYKRRIQANGIDYVLSKMKFGEITSDELRRMASELKGE